MESLNVAQIYYSIQSRPYFSGLPTLFIRLAGCNLHCDNCMVKDVIDKGKTMTFPEIEYELKKINCNNIEITGGEPLLQKDIISFLNFLIDRDYNIVLRSNGSILLKDIPSNITKIVDCKTPSSKEDNSFNYVNLRYLNKKDILRFIIAEERDYVWMKTLYDQYKLNTKCNILLYPQTIDIDVKDIVKWVLVDKIDVRLQLYNGKIPRVNL